MSTDWNRRMWGAATRAAIVCGVDKGELLHGMAAGMYGKESLKDLTDIERKAIVEACRSLSDTKEVDQLAPGYSTLAQRKAISAARNKLGWSWAKIRGMVHDYGAHDWIWLRQADADNLLQRLNQIVKGYARKNA